MVISYVKVKKWQKQNLPNVKLHKVGTKFVQEVQFLARLAQSMSNKMGKNC